MPVIDPKPIYPPSVSNTFIPWLNPPRPNVCPSCGRCRDCGHGARPQPYVNPYPVYPTPIYPFVPPIHHGPYATYSR